jgi:hypothetical protein
MRFLADMGVSLRVVEWLRGRREDVVHLRDEGLQRLSPDRNCRQDDAPGQPVPEGR